MIAELERELVADAAQRVQLFLAAPEIRQRHMDVVAAHARGALAERDVELVVLGKCAQRRAGRPLVDLERFVGFSHTTLRP
ncbi:MAG: hypothetical protein F4Z88_10575 [Chloroflexi bacterium]|nr:hypothetical protein [Chloroflexota bacterium]